MEEEATFLVQVVRSVGNGGGRRMMALLAEESKMVEEIKACHDEDTLIVDVVPLLNVIQDIFQRANLHNNPHSFKGKHDMVDALKKRIRSIGSGSVEPLPVTIQKISYEFGCKCTSHNIHASTMAILNLLRRYSWDAKVVITLAAFAVTYGELWLIILLDIVDHPLAKSIAILKQTPEISELDGVLGPKFAMLNDLVKVLVDVAKSLVEFRLLQAMNISANEDVTLINQIGISTYWTIRSILVCGAHISGNIGITSGLITSTAEAWDLSSLVHKEKSLHDQLVQQLALSHVI